MEQNKDWVTLESEYLFNRPWLTVRRDKVRLPNGAENPEFYVLEYPDWINVIAITDEGKFVFERQYRYGIRKVGYEICAGVIEEGEAPLEAAKRELSEETGYEGGKWTKLCTVCGNPSTSTNYTHCFLAEGVSRVRDQHLDATEDIEVILLSEKEVYDLMVEDKICQAMMLAPLWRYFALKDKPKE